MKWTERTVEAFAENLHAKKSVPGGGGVAALTGALGVALAGMVANFTSGKKKYADYEADIQNVLDRAEELRQSLLDMIDEDAKNFEPLSKAYGLPAETDAEKSYKANVLENATKAACSVPVKIVKTTYEAIELHAVLLDKGSALLISDVGVGVQCLRAALLSGWINVLVNLSSIADKVYVQRISEEIKPFVDNGIVACDNIFTQVEEKLTID